MDLSFDGTISLLKDILENPDTYRNTDEFGGLVEDLYPTPDIRVKTLSDQGVPFEICGKEMIEEGALTQMNIASRLPISVKGFLAPDAHHGYGLPIGGVLATNNAVIPYGVGVDIGCRMALTIYDVPDNYIDLHRHNLVQRVKDCTKFGQSEVHERPSDHSIMDNGLFKEIPFIKNLKDKAWRQLGSSGSSNHFVLIREVAITNDAIGVPSGRYLGILSHSGSRGMGAKIADHYTKLAMSKCILPQEAKHLAWLDLNSQEGQEYWLAMNLAGDYASACHHDIHKRLSKAIGIEPLFTIENHHNFAWKEVHGDQELIVHRKGATPAGKGVLGIIPGSMATHAFLVMGKGNTASLNSASHGAGRAMSRTEAKKMFTKEMMTDILKKKGVTLIGAGIDESPMAYKNIYDVMSQQLHLVDVVGTLMPRIVRMDNNPEDPK
jgi:tRNA-splicing ligase RtcB